MHERLEAIISGRVQMVMYRDFCQRKASKLGLVGYVQNKRDGTVHVVAEGPHSQLEAYSVELQKGPLLARVEKVEIKFQPVTGEFKKFQITYE